MFGLFGPEKVEFIDIYESTLTFRSKKKKHAPGHVSKVRLQVFLGETVQSLPLEVVVDSIRQLPDKSFLVISKILGNSEETQQMITIIDSAPRPDMGRLARRSERIPIGLRCLSQQLPGFRAVTVDLSLHGAQIQCEGTIEPGTVLDITFELEMSDLPKLTLRAVAVWSVAEEERRKAYKAGVEFTQQHPQTQVLWEKAYAYLLKMQSASVMHRSMSSDFSD
ncbi:MAG TPA: PilZ domain-containing protein [Phycisphaerales bacterium]|nr:PilZ domain-containing protein [Phycisphaerales bacterium]